MNIIRGGAANPEVNDGLASWCADQIGLPRPFEAPFTTIGVFEGERLLGAMVYNNWQPEAAVIEMHGAALSPRWLTRPVLREIFAYPFGQLGCQMVIMRVSERNDRLRRILPALGFDHVTIPRLRGRDEGECIFWLTQEAWQTNRFHEVNDGKVTRARAA